jgi:hypothetical protein
MLTVQPKQQHVHMIEMLGIPPQIACRQSDCCRVAPEMGRGMQQYIIPGAYTGTAKNFAACCLHGMQTEPFIAATGFGPVVGFEPEQPIAPALCLKGIVPLLKEGCAVGQPMHNYPHPVCLGLPAIFRRCRHSSSPFIIKRLPIF